jgi:NAD(P)-dependent dehydrogenase (short-subunit alcohol dehydrogenase family)
MAIALITGASGTRSGIGMSTAITLARAGHTVIATMRNPESAGELSSVVALFGVLWRLIILVYCAALKRCYQACWPVARAAS